MSAVSRRRYSARCQAGPDSCADGSSWYAPESWLPGSTCVQFEGQEVGVVTDLADHHWQPRSAPAFSRLVLRGL